MQTSENIRPDRANQGVNGASRTSFGPVVAYQNFDHVYLFQTPLATLQLSFVDAHVVRLRVHGETRPVLDTTAAIVERGQPWPVHFSETNTVYRLEAEFVQVVISKETAHIQVARQGQLQGFELIGLTRGENETVCDLAASVEDRYYGLGEKTGFLDKSGERVRMWNSDVYAPHNPETDALYVSVPFLIHRRGNLFQGVFLDNPGETAFDMRRENDTYQVTAATGDIDFYIFSFPTMKEVVSRYTQLTGRLALPPLWALGYHQSRYSYMNEREVRQLAEEFRTRDIPCDAIHFDIHYMNGYRVFTFDDERFPDPGELIRELATNGFHVVPIVDPGVKRDDTYGIFQAGSAMDAFCKLPSGDVFTGDVWPGESVFPDFTEMQVRNWWAASHQFYTDLGVRGIWNDMNEPAIFNETKTMDVSVVHGNDGVPKSHGELHNLYGLLMSQATYEGLKRLVPNERPFVLTRSGYAGIGRFAAVWTGDNRSFWEHMAMAIPMVLNMGLTGIPFAGPDVGGFAHDASGQLLARWTQMGAFFPYFRNHSEMASVRQEPWAFGAEIEEICRTYIRLRYAYLPHLYNLFHEATQTGLPVLRPLVLEYPEDTSVVNLSDAFLVGEDLLVAPILQPDATKRLVYLPGDEWIDYWTGEVFAGSQYIIADAPLNRLPLYVRRRGILARHDVGTHADFTRVETLAFDVYGIGERTSYELYEDDGVSYAYELGQFNRYHLRVEASATGAIVSGRYLHQGYDVAYRRREICLKSLSGLLVSTFDTVDVIGFDRLTEREFPSADRGWTLDEWGCLRIRIPVSEAAFTIHISR